MTYSSALCWCMFLVNDMCMLPMHCGRRRPPEIFIASIRRSSDLPRKFLRKCHEVDRNCLDDLRKIFEKYAVDLPKNCQTLGLSVILQIYVKTAEIYVMSNWSETINLGLFGKVWVLFVCIWLISAWDSRGNEKSQPRSVWKITQGYCFSFEFLLFLWFSLWQFLLVTPLN